LFQISHENDCRKGDDPTTRDSAAERLSTFDFRAIDMSTFHFVRDAIRNPLQVGSIVPSSGWLARSIVDAVGVRDGDILLELGPGTGAFTAELVSRFPRHRIIAVELGASMARGLQRRFPKVEVVTGSAEDLTRILDRMGIQRVDRIVSGLPWALWSPGFQERLLDEVACCLSPEGRFVTFHYLHSIALGRVRSTRQLLCRRFREVHFTRPTWINLPPALVHVADRPWLGASVPSGSVGMAPAPRPV
jgi:phospholipid N-methyltransferase